ncbi:hypothetical protein KAK06_19830 [Ideonella sp. 4Y11]|uniref:Bacterial Ig-like domain-containing protein n=1 Tax=Ideonella aquatica TaxID=2824119 RepID=A0A940YMA6_9BURK|nr:Ig-like domain-containing protein [Ideonella aquatica]MBQ0961217.1 hypothetical protein [Ideonella aquatica]
MTTRRLRLNLAAAAAAVLIVSLAACGGGNGVAPPQDGGHEVTATVPVVTITHNITDETASGDITFTFSFNVDVGTSFTADDIAVSGGTKGAFIRRSGTAATLVVTPTPASSGTVQVTVLAAGVTDAVGTVNAETSASQAFNTTLRSGVVSFDETTAPILAGFGGAEDAAVVVDPSRAGNLVARIVKSATAEPWAGTTLSTAAGNTLPRIGFAAGRSTITARIWSPVAGIPVRMKVEDSTRPAKTVETEATVTTASGWQTLSFDFSRPVPGTPTLDLAASYDRLSVFFDFGTPGATVGAARTYYLDNLIYPWPAGGGSTGPLVFSSGFGAGNRTVEGGEFGGFSGSNLDGYACNGDPANCGSGGGFTPAVSAADSYFFYYHQTATPATDLFMGIYVQAPGVSGGLTGGVDTAGLQVGSQTQLKFKLGQNAEWFSAPNHNVLIVADLGKRFTVGANTDCRLQLHRVLTATAASATDYAVPLSSFVLSQDCGGAASSVADALAKSPLSQLSFQGVGGGIAVSDGTLSSGANLSVLNGSGVYPSTLVLVGGITIE